MLLLRSLHRQFCVCIDCVYLCVPVILSRILRFVAAADFTFIIGFELVFVISLVCLFFVLSLSLSLLQPNVPN